ncbi:hypothetical protein ACFW2Y_34410 [Streptomyces sp. NPDC058877]|uniref:hypothetical protein n=1 Tax=Streptomyces sp. NPDC058877 TaxID=3346665 RepID=UPI00368A3BC8
MSGQTSPSAVEGYHTALSSGLSMTHLQICGLEKNVDGLGARVEALDKKIDRNQAQIIELLTQLVGQRSAAG